MRQSTGRKKSQKLLIRTRKYIISRCKECGKEFSYPLTQKRVYCSNICQTLNSHRVNPITYKGIKYRSSWEVDFVKFLESYHLSWEYEPKTFKLTSLLAYTPDFYIKEFDCWVEVKGKETEKNKEQYMLFKEKISDRFFVIRGHSYLDYLWWIQEVFNRNFFNFEKLTLHEQEELTKEFVVHLMAEVTEVLSTINWKMHHPHGEEEIIKSKIITEIVDVWKYIVGLSQVWGLTAFDILDGYRKKSKVVELKYSFGKELLHLKDKNVVAIDIDGVLAPYPEHFLQYVNSKLNSNYDDYRDAKAEIEPLLLLDLKTQYRESGLKAKMPVINGAKEFLSELRLRGYYIILLSSRPIEKHPNLYYDTYYWLWVNGLQYNAIYFSEYKHIEIIKKVPNLMFMVEDNLEYANQIAGRGYKVYLVDNRYNKGQEHTNVKRVNLLTDILKEELTY